MSKLTEKGKPVIPDKFYEVKYKWGKGYKYGYSWINSNHKDYCGYVDIICHDGGVTYQHIDNVIFLKQIHQ